MTRPLASSQYHLHQRAMKSLLFAGLGALLSLPFSFAASPHEELVQLASAGNGVIKLTAETFDLLTSPKRTWSASVQLTALDARRRCNPCKYVFKYWTTFLGVLMVSQRIRPPMASSSQVLGCRQSRPKERTLLCNSGL